MISVTLFRHSTHFLTLKVISRILLLLILTQSSDALFPGGSNYIRNYRQSSRNWVQNRQDAQFLVTLENKSQNSSQIREPSTIKLEPMEVLASENPKVLKEVTQKPSFPTMNVFKRRIGTHRRKHLPKQLGRTISMPVSTTETPVQIRKNYQKVTSDASIQFSQRPIFFFLIFLCTATTSLAYISPYYFRTKPYISAVAISALQQRSPVRIERELPKMESVEFSGNIPEPKEQPFRIMDIITVPDSLGKFFGQMPIRANEISQVNDIQNLLAQNRQQSLERQAEQTATAKPSRRRYDHNCFFTPINCRPWIEPSRRIQS